MTKYYYEGHLIRSSKTRNDYRYALLRFKDDGTIVVYKCSSKREYCEQELEYRCKGETLSNQYGTPFEEAWHRYPISTGQLWKRASFKIVELEVRA